MAAISWTDVLALAPELSSVSTLGRAIVLDYVNETLDVTAFGGEDSARTKLARVLLAAHLGTVAPTSQGNPGMVSSEMVSATMLQTSWAAQSSAQSALDASSYGAELRRLYRLALARKGPVLLSG